MKGVKKTVQELLIGGITVLVILQERVLSDDAAKGFVTLNSGKNVDYDFLVRIAINLSPFHHVVCTSQSELKDTNPFTQVHCGGQKPPSQFLTNLSPESINESGHLRVKGTMQLVDETLPNIYACGDITNIGTRNPNSRITMQQAKIAADNIVTVASGKQPRYKYTPHWAEAVIKLTLGLV
jgi:hypothetical protein